MSQRKVLKLRYSEGLGLDGIATKLNISQVTVKRLFRSGIEKLRERFVTLGALSPDAPLPKDNIPSFLSLSFGRSNTRHSVQLPPKFSQEGSFFFQIAQVSDNVLL